MGEVVLDHNDTLLDRCYEVPHNPTYHSLDIQQISQVNDLVWFFSVKQTILLDE